MLNILCFYDSILNMQNLEKKFEEIGLSEKEAKVYLALLKLGRGTAYKVAKIAGVKTPTTYLMLDELLKKGLALKIPHSKSQIFIAKMPDEYLDEQKSKLSSFENILPQLENFGFQKDETKTITFDGYDGILDALNYKFSEISGKTIFAFYSHLPNPDERIIDIYLKWNVEAKKAGIKHKIMAPDIKESHAFMKPQEDKYKGNTKLIPTELWSPEASLEIVENEFVRIISSKDLQATVIDNKRVAKAMKQIFDMIWNSGLGRDYK